MEGADELWMDRGGCGWSWATFLCCTTAVVLVWEHHVAVLPDGSWGREVEADGGIVARFMLEG